LCTVVIGDSKTLQYWEYKKGELQKTFASEPFSSDVSRVVISGTADKASVFVASGSQIRGFTKRGKDFFKLDSSHTDAILHLHVQA
jgi:Bardet-Biedl syndrome 7 protein